MFTNDRMVGSEGDETSWSRMNLFEKNTLTNNIKAKSAVMLIQATHFAESKNYQKAKEILVQIADNCSLVKQPDQQILNWVEIACNFLAVLHRKSQAKKPKCTEKKEKKSWHIQQAILNLSYNKFLGEFEFDKKNSNYEETFLTQQVKQYVSKINTILLDRQNGENNHSMYVMWSLYWIPFTILLLVLVLIALYLFIPAFMTMDQNIFNFRAPPIIFGTILLVPLFMIYKKGFEQKDSTFFQKKLGEQIKKINIDCKKRGNNFEFMMPHEGQINIKYSKLGDPAAYERQGLQSGFDSIQQTPQEEIMDQIKGLTREISKLSKHQIISYPNLEISKIQT